MRRFTALVLLLASLVLSSCQSAYFGAMEKFGVHKRDILVERVEDGIDAQEEAKEQFEDAFAAFVAVSGVEVGELKQVYQRFKDAFDASEKKAEAVWSRIEGIESVSEALFAEWEKELALYSNPDLRSASADQLKRTRRKAAELLTAMRAAANRMKPVLDAFRDQTLFLKHNLNAQAVAALDRTASDLRGEVNDLIRQMDQSIREASSFVAQLRTDAK